jgi:hypothetical protein
VPKRGARIIASRRRTDHREVAQVGSTSLCPAMPPIRAALNTRMRGGPRRPLDTLELRLSL